MRFPGRPLCEPADGGRDEKLNVAIAEIGAPPQTGDGGQCHETVVRRAHGRHLAAHGAGFDSSEGIDVKLAKMAEDDGDAIKGFETVELQSENAVVGHGWRNSLKPCVAPP